MFIIFQNMFWKIWKKSWFWKKNINFRQKYQFFNFVDTADNELHFKGRIKSVAKICGLGVRGVGVLMESHDLQDWGLPWIRPFDFKGSGAGFVSLFFSKVDPLMERALLLAERRKIANVVRKHEESQRSERKRGVHVLKRVLKRIRYSKCQELKHER